ncbi:MAG TPA: dihydrolipoyl dehydrogenase [Candidatus Gastranaerophilaceae bacterium]|nr:dihydrolipoyl dehydrogenase [Candidatus Gastranaerophilaceae bacterium]
MTEISDIKSDICILGGGPAGYFTAIRASQLGASVVLIEQGEIGGTCLNRGCIPTKALLKTAEVADLLNKSNEFGIQISEPSFIIQNSISRKDKTVKNLKMGLEFLLNSKNINILKGKGTILSKNIIKVVADSGEFLVSFDKLIITSGSEPLKPNIKGIDLKNVITSNEAINIQEIPQNLTIIGAGVIGLEFATFFNALGSKVSIVELQQEILPHEDKEAVEELIKIMKRRGIKFYLGAGVNEIKEVDSELVTIFEQNGQNINLNSNYVLVAVGRKLNLSDDILNLGIKTKNGAIEVNEFMQTNVEGVFAAGDVTGGMLLAHLAFAQGKIAAENACGHKNKFNEVVPSCIYTHPELASIGLVEHEAGGRKLKIGKFEFRHNGRSLCNGHREGFVKVLVDASSDEIVGAHILGANASELISELTLAIKLKAKAQDLANMIHPHPTLSEAVMEACADAAGYPFHK